MKKFFSLSIRARLFLITLIVALPAAGIIIYSGLKLRDEAIQDAREETRKIAESIAAEQQSLVTAAQQLIIALTQLPDVKNQNPSRVQPVLKNILALNEQYSNIFIADRSGRVWATAVPVKPPFIISDRRYFVNAIASGRLSSGEFIISRATEKPSFNFAYPLRNERGEITGTINVGFVTDSFTPLLERTNLPQGTVYMLLDHAGRVMSKSIDPAKYLGKQIAPALFARMKKGAVMETFIGVDFDGTERIITYRKLHLAGEESPYMYVRAGIPVTVVLFDANKVLFGNLALYSSFLLLAFFVASYIGKRLIADRISLLEKASRDLAHGDLQTRISDLVAGGELGNLGRTFDDMASQLAAREQALVESEKNYREIFNTSQDAICVLNAVSGEITEMNKTVETMFGYSRKELLHQTVEAISAGEPPYSRQEALEWIQKSFQEGHQLFEWLCKKKNGELFWTEVVLSATHVGEKGRVLAVIRDISERKRAEEEKQNLQLQLVQSQKMESIGRLAGGVAHDFNNMLSVILGYTELIKNRLPGNDPFLPDLQAIEKAACHARDVTTQLLAFSRKQVIVPVPINLNDIIADTQKTLAPLIGEDIELLFEPSISLWNIMFDPSQIKQILVNLAVNARDAMPAGGKLIIKTTNKSIRDFHYHDHGPHILGDYVLLEVSDNGHGMDAETISHIFEPFFTTKGVGEGTGLGLATVYGIVEQNGGFVSVSSMQDVGTTFSVYIPKSMEQPAKPAQTEAIQASTGTGRILLVEDDSMVSKLLVDMLSSIGYTVFLANKPADAVSLCTKSEIEIDLLITDVIMPDMNGRELRDQIKLLRPEIKVLFMSGYASDVIVHQGIPEEEMHFIQKPFSIADVAHKIQDVLRAS